MRYIELHTTDEVKDLIGKSRLYPGEHFVIFKHSSRCITSRMAYKEFDESWDLPVPYYLVHVLDGRPASNEIEFRLKVKHESPQAIVIRNGEVLYHNSHSSIEPRRIIGMVSVSEQGSSAPAGSS